MKTQIDVPAKYRKLISRAKEGTVSPRQAIKAKCIECCGFDIKTAQDCRVPSCPLYEYNPYRKARR